MKLNIEELLAQVPDDLKEAEMFEAFARLIVERCAVECDNLQKFYEDEAKKHTNAPMSAAFRDGEDTGSEACAATIRNLLESE